MNLWAGLRCSGLSKFSEWWGESGVRVWRVSYSRIAPQKNKWNPRFNKYHLIKSDHSQLQCKQTHITIYETSSTIFRRNKTYTRNTTIYIQKSFDIVHIHFSNSWVFLSFKNPTLPIQLSFRYPMYPSIKTRISGLCERVSPALVVPQFGLSRGNMAMPTAIGFTKKLPLEFAYVFCGVSIGFSCLMLKWFKTGFLTKQLEFVCCLIWFSYSFSSHVMVFWMLNTKNLPQQK